VTTNVVPFVSNLSVEELRNAMHVMSISGSRRCLSLLLLVAATSIATPWAVFAAGAASQTQDSGSATTDNGCTATYDPAVQPLSQAAVGVTVATDAFPEPHLGDAITLFNTQLTVAIPAAAIQPLGDLGLVADGTTVPLQMTLPIAGSNTTESTQTLSVTGTTTARVISGVAQPADVTVDLPNTVWHPVDASMPVSFTQPAFTIAASSGPTAALGLVVTLTLDCTPTSPPPTILTLGSGISVTMTTTAVSTTTTTTTVSTTTTTTTDPPATTTTTDPPATTTTTDPPATTTTTDPPATTTTTDPPATTPTTRPSSCDKAGYGYGDRKHLHCGPPGSVKRAPDDRGRDR
jgi:hypothetical protein